MLTNFLRRSAPTSATAATGHYYALQSDHVQMPPFESFKDAESYSATLGHEAVHWTRHSFRLDRDFGRKAWGDEGYAREELVAELGSAFLAADLSLYLEPARGSCFLHLVLVGGLKKRQAGDFLGGQSRTAGSRLPSSATGKSICGHHGKSRIAVP